MSELRIADGPLGDAGLADVARLYGHADNRYARRDWLAHLFTDGPAGPATHVFADVDGRAVGHCAVVPLPGLTAAGPLLTGKVEAFYIEDSHRSAELAVGMLRALYERAERRGVEVLHAIASPELGVLHRMAGCRARAARVPARLAVLAPVAVARGAGRTPVERAGSLAAGALHRAALAARGAGERPRERGPLDAAALAPCPPPPGAWVLDSAAMAGWLQRSPALRAFATAAGSALVALPAARGEAAQVLAAEPTVRAARLLAAVARAVRGEAGTLRVPLWGGPADDALARAARTLGFVSVEDELTVYVRARAAPAVPVVTPFLSATF